MGLFKVQCHLLNHKTNKCMIEQNHKHNYSYCQIHNVIKFGYYNKKLYEKINNSLIKNGSNNINSCNNSSINRKANTKHATDMKNETEVLRSNNQSGEE
jgi:hypothetical protein